ncbi:MAG TPA: hypothetical protein VFF40_11135 [Acidimicrobiia bacterium]|nr:hypothetical protein [Acidimicrobiia bacterium]
MLITAFGVVAATTMVVAYGLEARATFWIAIFAVGCLATAIYGVLTGAWIFVALESVWAGLALHRFDRARAEQA